MPSLLQLIKKNREETDLLDQYIAARAKTTEPYAAEQKEIETKLALTFIEQQGLLDAQQQLINDDDLPPLAVGADLSAIHAAISSPLFPGRRRRLVLAAWESHKNRANDLGKLSVAWHDRAASGFVQAKEAAIVKMVHESGETLEHCAKQFDNPSHPPSPLSRFASAQPVEMVDSNRPGSSRLVPSLKLARPVNRGQTVLRPLDRVQDDL